MTPQDQVQEFMAAMAKAAPKAVASALTTIGEQLCARKSTDHDSAAGTIHGEGDER